MPGVPKQGDPLIYKKLGAERASCDEEELLLSAGWGAAFDETAREEYEALFGARPGFETAWKPLLADLSSPRPGDRIRGIELVLKAACQQQPWLRHPRVTEALMESLRGADGETLEKTCQALVPILGHFPDRRVHAACLPLLTHPQPRVRAAAVWSVALAGGAGAWSDVLPLVSDRVAEVRKAALSSLSKACLDLPEEGRARLQSAAIAALDDRVDEVRMAAAILLGSIGDSASLQALAGLKSRRMVWRETVSWAVTEIQKRAASASKPPREESPSRKAKGRK